MKIKSIIAHFLLKLVRAYFVGRTVHWMTRMDGQPLYRGEGKVVSGRVDRDTDKNVIGMTLFWSMPGRPIYEMKQVSVFKMERDKTLTWVFYE